VPSNIRQTNCVHFDILRLFLPVITIIRALVFSAHEKRNEKHHNEVDEQRDGYSDHIHRKLHDHLAFQGEHHDDQPLLFRQDPEETGHIFHRISVLQYAYIRKNECSQSDSRLSGSGQLCSRSDAVGFWARMNALANWPSTCAMIDSAARPVPAKRSLTSCP
jgi:hypothetical protein